MTVYVETSLYRTNISDVMNPTTELIYMLSNFRIQKGIDCRIHKYVSLFINVVPIFSLSLSVKNIKIS